MVAKWSKMLSCYPTALRTVVRIQASPIIVSLMFSLFFVIFLVNCKKCILNQICHAVQEL